MNGSIVLKAHLQAEAYALPLQIANGHIASSAGRYGQSVRLLTRTKQKDVAYAGTTTISSVPRF